MIEHDCADEVVYDGGSGERENKYLSMTKPDLFAT